MRDIIIKIGLISLLFQDYWVILSKRFDKRLRQKLFLNIVKFAQMKFASKSFDISGHYYFNNYEKGSSTGPL